MIPEMAWIVAQSETRELAVQRGLDAYLAAALDDKFDSYESARNYVIYTIKVLVF